MGRTCIVLPGVELEDSKDGHFWNINVLEWENKFTLGLNAAKNQTFRIIYYDK